MPPTLPQVSPLALLLILGLLASVVVAWIWAILQFAFNGRIVPRFEPRIVPWGAGSVLATLIIWLATQVLVLYGFLYLTRGTTTRLKNQAPLSPSEMMTNSALQNGVILVVVPLLLAALSRARPRDFVRLDRRAGWQVLQGFVAWPLAMPVVYGMMVVAVRIWGKESHPLETAIQREGTGGKAVIFFLAGVILAPAAEELIFRGVLLGWLDRLILQGRRGRPGMGIKPEPIGLGQPEDAALPPLETPAQAVSLAATVHGAPSVPADPYTPPLTTLVSPEGSWHPDVGDEKPSHDRSVTARLWLANLSISLLFAGLHYTDWPTPVPIFFLSLVLGFLYQRTGSLVAPVTLHMTFNGISTVLMFLTLGASAPSGPAEPPNQSLPAPVPKPVDPITPPGKPAAQL